jgi:hypothetical protein
MIKRLNGYGFKYMVQVPESGALPEDFPKRWLTEWSTFHMQLPGYRPTALVRWSNLAKRGAQDVL